MKKLLLIILIVPLFAISQDRGHGGRGGVSKVSDKIIPKIISKEILAAK